MKRGYIGIVSLLVGVCIIAALSVFVFKKSMGTDSAEGNQFQDAQTNIQKAEDVKALIEQRNQPAAE